MPLQLVGYFVDRTDVGSDVFALHPIATSSCSLQLPIAVNDRDSQSVEFGLGYVVEIRGCRGTEPFVNASVERYYVLIRKRVVQRQHRHLMDDHTKTRRRAHRTHVV